MSQDTDRQSPRKRRSLPVRLFIWSIIAMALLVVVVLGANQWVIKSAKGLIYRDTGTIPENRVAIVLGTSPYVGKRKNLFFEARMNATAALWKAGKIRHVLVSGDNGTKNYDEPTAMRDALVKRGLPADAITLDHAGFRTLDTMARAKAVFDLEKATVVTDDFHLPRALFLAKAHGLNPVGFQSDPIPFDESSKTRLREVGSRVKAWLDVYILKTKPKFYGSKISLETDETKH